MPDYYYRGVDRTGNSIKGTITAGNVSMLESKLAETGSVFIELLDNEDKGKGLGKTNISIFKTGVKNRELIDLFTTLKIMTKAGITLLDSLKTIREEVGNPLLRKSLNDIIFSVEAGNLFSDSLAHYPKIFSGHIVRMIKAGESSGNLPETFEELIRYMEWQEALKKDVRQATAYPITVLSVLTVFILILFTFVVPRFIKLLTDLNAPLPFPTRMVMVISNFLTTKWWIWLPAILFMFFAFLYAKRRQNKFSLAIDKMKLNIMVFGELIRMLTISRFAYNFAAFHKSGIPIIRNLELCESLVGNKVMEVALKGARQDIIGGVMLNESLRKYEIFPAKVLMMIAVGETSGELVGAFNHIANYYNEEIPRRIKKIFGIMEPVVMLFIIGVVGFTVAAIILPIISLFGAAK